jgi:hypothetical protein
MQSLESLESVWENQHSIMSTHVTIILPNIDCYDTTRVSLREALQFLMTIVGPETSATSQNRSHAVPWKPEICMERPAQDNVNPCDKNIAKLDMWHLQIY